MPLNLTEVREMVWAWSETIRDREGRYGSYRGVRLCSQDDREVFGRIDRHRPSLYASCDMAWVFGCMGEDFRQVLTGEQRAEWAAFINTFNTHDGTYVDCYGHSKHHANGMVIGALAVLGGQQPRPVCLYDDLDTPEKAVPWLEKIDWRNQWGGSHLFWGAMHCFSMSKRCTPEWLDTVIGWLDENLDPDTGWWRKGVPHSGAHQPLGGSVHIIPIYEHHERPFPYPERVIDSTLALQLPEGNWRGMNSPATYLELDALYAMRYMSKLAPGYRQDAIDASLDRFIALTETWWHKTGKNWFKEGSNIHPHAVLALTGALGLLQQFRPDDYPDTNTWTDIFTHQPFYDTAAVEVLPKNAA